MANRGFLSHSSADKAFANELFALLDRASIIYDKKDFDAGEPFTAEIAAKLASAGFFVLLASRRALASKWVQLEISQAQSLKQAGVLAKAIVLLYDGATHAELPGWLQDGLARPVINPMQAAIIIKDRQKELIAEHQRPVFLNRFNELQLAADALNGRSIEARTSLHTLAFFGPPGHGRHSLAGHVFENSVGLHKTFSVRLESGDTDSDIAIKLAQFSEVYADRDDLQNVIDELELMDAGAIETRTREYLSTIQAENALLVLDDIGGLLDGEGYYESPISRLIAGIESTPGSYAAIVSRRKPKTRGGVRPLPIRVSALDRMHSEDLARRYRDIVGANRLNDDQLSRIVEFVGGHPQALRYALEQTVERGAELVLTDLNRLVRHNLDSYWAEIRNDIRLSDAHRRVIVGLAYYGPAPLSVAERLSGVQGEKFVSVLDDLLESVFVEVDETQQYYQLPSSLLELATRLFPEIHVDHDAAYEGLDSILRTSGPELPNRLALERSRGRALALGSRRDRQVKVIQLAADWIQNAERAYRDERWLDAYEFAKSAVDRRPGNLDAHRILIQSLVKLGTPARFAEAHRRIDEIDDGRFQYHDIDYFRGVLAYGENRVDEALRWYESAVANGRYGLAIHRELASCYFRIGDTAKAQREVDEAKRLPDGRRNRFLRDLEIKIAIVDGDEDKSRAALEVADQVDTRPHYYLLSALVNIAFGEFEKAVSDLDESDRYRGRKVYTTTFPRAVSLIALRRFRDADASIRTIRALRDETQRTALSAGLLWSRGRAGEALQRLDEAAGAQGIDALRDFFQRHDVYTEEAGRKIARILLNLHFGLVDDEYFDE